MRLSLFCAMRAFRARSFVRQHGLELDRAAHHGGVGIHLPEKSRKGIPTGSGFDFPILPIIFFINSIATLYWVTN